MIKSLLIPLLILFIIGCRSTTNFTPTKENLWRLGWRMIENSWDDKYETANSQFDSLLNLSTKINVEFLIEGLKIKYKLDKKDDINSILEKQSKYTLQQICSKKIIPNANICNSFDEFIEEKVENKSLQLELIRMYVKDQRVRGNPMNNMIQRYKLDSIKAISQLMSTIDNNNQVRLKEIFEEFGFPNKKMVGQDAMNSIFIIIQHADKDKDWQENQLQHIEKAVRHGDLKSQNYAYLYDRIKINDGKKQLYGTQFENIDLVNNIAELANTEDIKNLDKRRMEVGLMPIQLYKEYMLRNL